MASKSGKQFTKADYESCEFHVGVHRDEDGNPLVVVDGKCIGTVAGVLDFVGRYRSPVKADGRIAVLEAKLEGLVREIPRRVSEAVEMAYRRNARM